MRIAYVITRADAVGGASIHVRDLARAMRERGHEVLVLLGGSGPVVEQLGGAGVPYRSLAFLQRQIDPVRDLRAARELAAALKAFGPDLVSTHTAKAGWIGRAVCRRLGLPAIYTPHGWPVSDRLSRAHGPVFRVAERIAARWASAIVCVCEYERQLAIQMNIAPAERLHVIRNGVHDVAPALRAVPESHPPRLISVARFESPKDHKTLFEALAALRAHPWELELVGDGPLEGELRRAAAALGIAERIRFRGYLSDPSPALAAAQIFVLSSRSEGFPRSVLEAMRAGLPVVASNVGGIGEAIDAGAEGVLVPRANAAALAAALEKTILNPSERQRMGRLGRRSYELRFQFERVAEETAALYGNFMKEIRSSGVRLK